MIPQYTASDLERAQRHVTDGERNIETLQRILDDRKRLDLPTEETMRVLENMLKLLGEMQQQLSTIEAEVLRRLKSSRS